MGNCRATSDRRKYLMIESFIWTGPSFLAGQAAARLAHFPVSPGHPGRRSTASGYSEAGAVLSGFPPGRSSTTAVVYSSVVILIANYLLTQMLLI